jgi:hypothetical protein
MSSDSEMVKFVLIKYMLNSVCTVERALSVDEGVGVTLILLYCCSSLFSQEYPQFTGSSCINKHMNQTGCYQVPPHKYRPV